MSKTYEVPSDIPLLLRLDKISSYMEENWQIYEFKSKQEMVDHYFWLIRKSTGILLAAKDDDIGIKTAKTPEDILRIFPIDDFRKTNIAQQGRERGYY